MSRQQGYFQGRPLALALAVGCLASLLAAPGWAANQQGLNGPGLPANSPEFGELSLGDLAVSSPEGCTLAYAVQVFTDAGTGDDTFELQVVDDGVIVSVRSLSAPADGAIHQLSGTLQLNHAVSQAIPGVGVYLVDDGTILDAVDPVVLGCGIVEIPTLDTAGAWLLGGLLLACGLVVLRRPRPTS